MVDDRTPEMALLPGERAMTEAEWAEYGGLPPTLRAYCHRLLRDEAEAQRLQRLDALEIVEWRARAARLLDRLGAAEQRAVAAVADAQAAAHFAQSVAHLLASPGAEAEAVQHLRAADLPHLLDCLRERLAEAQPAEAPNG